MRLHPSCSRSWSGAQINCSPNIHIQRGTHDSCFISVRYFILGVSRKHQYKTSLFFGHELNKRMLQFFPEMLKFNWYSRIFFGFIKSFIKKQYSPEVRAHFSACWPLLSPGSKTTSKGCSDALLVRSQSNTSSRPSSGYFPAQRTRCVDLSGRDSSNSDSFIVSRRKTCWSWTVAPTWGEGAVNMRRLRDNYQLRKSK